MVRSFASRLFVVAALAFLVGCIVITFLLQTFFQGFVERSLDTQLNGVFETLVFTHFNPETGELRETAEGLENANYNIPLSGWYWVMAEVGDVDTIAFSKSFSSDGPGILSTLYEGPDPPEVAQTLYFETQSGEALRVLRQSIIIGITGRRYVAVLTAPREIIDREIRRFSSVLALVYGVLFVSLIAAIYFQVRIGLSPIKTIQSDLEKIRDGRSQEMDGRYPVEVGPLISELNGMIKANKEIVERARTHVGNLAHALKTPLSVIQNEARADQGALSEVVATQTEVMQRQITYHLDRARMAASVKTLGVKTDVKKCVDRLARVLGKIYQSNGIEIEVDIADDTFFRGEEQDFEEIIGNVMDNACKWATSRVQITTSVRSNSETQKRTLIVCVEDDGPGLTAKQQQEVRKRGARLDEQKPGSGLGLSIVTDLVDLYDGDFEMSVSKLGGLKVELTLAAV